MRNGEFFFFVITMFWGDCQRWISKRFGRVRLSQGASLGLNGGRSGIRDEGGLHLDHVLYMKASSK